MLRETLRQFNILMLVLTLLFGSAAGARAQSPIEDAIATALHETDLRHARQGRGRPLHGRLQKGPCNAKRRALVGSAIGAVIGMVALRQVAEEKGGTVSAKDTLGAGGLGGALGAAIGSTTCRRR